MTDLPPARPVSEDDSSLREAAAALRAGQQGQSDRRPDQAHADQGHRRRRHRGRGGQDTLARDDLADALQALSAELAASRREADRLRERLEEVQALRLEEARELGEVRRQRDGLQYRTDYLEEKLDGLARRMAPRARRPWWRLW